MKVALLSPLRVAVSVAITGAALALYLSRQREFVAIDQTGLTVPRRTIELGKVWPTRNYHHSVVVKNIGSVDVQVSDLRSSCSCTSITPKQFVVRPGEDVTLDAVLDLNSAVSKLSPDVKTGSLDVDLSLKINGSWGHKISLHADVRRPLNGLPTTLDLGTFSTRSDDNDSYPTRSVNIDTDVSLSAFSADCEDRFAKVSVKADSPRKHILTITPSAELPAGDFEFPVLVSAGVDGIADRIPPSPIAVRGTIDCPADWYPHGVNLGFQPVGSQKVFSFSIWNKPGMNSKLLKARSNSNDISVQQLRDGPTNQVDFRISVNILRPEEIVSTVVFELETLNSHFSVELPVQAKGYTLVTDK